MAFFNVEMSNGMKLTSQNMVCTELFHMESVFTCHQCSNMAHHNMNLGTCGISKELHITVACGTCMLLGKKNSTSSDPYRDQTKTVIASDTSYGSIYDIFGISFLTFYSSILSDSLIILT